MTLPMERGGAKAQQGLASHHVVYSCVALDHLLALRCHVYTPGQCGGQTTHKCYYILGQGSQTVVSGSAASASPENFTEMKIIRTCPTPTVSETWWVGGSDLCFNKPFGWFQHLRTAGAGTSKSGALPFACVSRTPLTVGEAYGPLLRAVFSNT